MELETLNILSVASLGESAPAGRGELGTLRSALPLSPLGYAAYMSEASLKKGVGRLKELET